MYDVLIKDIETETKIWEALNVYLNIFVSLFLPLIWKGYMYILFLCSDFKMENISALLLMLIQYIGAASTLIKGQIP